MKLGTRNAIISSAESLYRDLGNPNYDFVTRVARESPYQSLVSSLSSRFAVDEQTDLNDDVSFRFALRKRRQSWTLGLSMVGPYGFLGEIGDSGVQFLSEESSSIADRQSRWLIDRLRSEGIVLLSAEDLAEPVPEATFDGVDQPAVFDLLFAAGDWAA